VYGSVFVFAVVAVGWVDDCDGGVEAVVAVGDELAPEDDGDCDGVAAGGDDVWVAVVVPLSGSVYWLSPAEGPEASAIAGPLTSAANTKKPISGLRIRLTLRVWQVMRLLAFSDLHRDRGQAERLVELARDADLVVGAGDFATMHLGLEQTIEALAPIDKPAVLVPGNHETEAALWRACADWPSAVILHGEGKKIAGVQFYGLGAGVPPTPFPWSFDLSDEEAAAKLAACPEGCVLVSHSPPRGYMDVVRDRHLGSESVLRTIETKRPALAVCGHIHECWGQGATIGTTPTVNLGPGGRFFDV
jgi:uncharacterized protein